MLPPAALLVVTLLLAGCVPSEPNVTPVPEPSATPIFASDEEALAAATDAYAKYLEVSDAIFANGGEGADALSEVLAGDQLQIENDGFVQVQTNGWHSIGSTKFDQVVLQQFDPTSNGASIVVAYLCEDISGTQVLNATGESVRAEGLRERSLYEVTFDASPEASSLLVSDKDIWGSGKC